MKKLSILLLICLAAAKPFAQSIELKFNSYTGNAYQISIENKMSCDADVRISWMKGGINKDTSVMISGGGFVYVLLPAAYSAGSTIKAKSDSPCSSNGWISIIVPATLALEDNRILRPTTIIPDKRKVRVVSFSGNYYADMEEEELKAKRYLLRRTYFIIRDNRTKEIIL